MNLNTLLNKYNENGPLGLSYSEMNWLFESQEDLQLQIDLLQNKIRRYEETLVSVKNSDTLDHAKRMARIALD